MTATTATPAQLTAAAKREAKATLTAAGIKVHTIGANARWIQIRVDAETRPAALAALPGSYTVEGADDRWLYLNR